MKHTRHSHQVHARRPDRCGVYGPAFAAALTILVCSIPRPSPAAPLSLEQALDTALGGTSRAGMIRGNQEVAEQTYQARRITFFVPSISINGAVPAYTVDQSYRFFGSSARKRLYKTRGLGFNSFIQLQQSLLTGGNLQLRANLNSDQDHYPDTDPLARPGNVLSERTRRGYFDLSLTQPLLKPSSPKNELEDKKDDLELARLARREAQTTLAQEVIAAYVGVLEAVRRDEASAAKSEAARRRAEVDSMKWQDGVIAEEAWLASASGRLDADLAHREAASALSEKRRELALLLERDPTDPVEPVEPSITDHPDAERREDMRNNWERSLAVRRAEVECTKASRAAAFAAAGHGLTGDLTASYSVGRGKVTVVDPQDVDIEDNINTNGWGVALNFSYPIWDGGASTAALKAARFEAERARLELQKAKQSARADLLRRTDQLDVSYRRLGILKKSVELAENRLSIARTRLADGRISQTEFLDSQVILAEAQASYLKEVQTYLSNRMGLAQEFLE